MANEIINSFNKIAAVIRSTDSRRRAVSSVLGPHKERIFSKGQASDGSQIGTYSTNPISISKSRQAKNTGKTFFPGGVAEYHNAIGKNPGHVILRDTDQMYADYNIVQNGEELGYGFQNEFNAQKMGWNEDHFDKDITSLSDDEFNKYVEVLIYELNRAF